MTPLGCVFECDLSLRITAVLLDRTSLLGTRRVLGELVTGEDVAVVQTLVEDARQWGVALHRPVRIRRGRSNQRGFVSAFADQATLWIALAEGGPEADQLLADAIGPKRLNSQQVQAQDLGRLKLMLEELNGSMAELDQRHRSLQQAHRQLLASMSAREQVQDLRETEVRSVLNEVLDAHARGDAIDEALQRLAALVHDTSLPIEPKRSRVASDELDVVGWGMLDASMGRGAAALAPLVEVFEARIAELRASLDAALMQRAHEATEQALVALISAAAVVGAARLRWACELMREGLLRPHAMTEQVALRVHLRAVNVCADEALAALRQELNARQARERGV